MRVKDVPDEWVLEAMEHTRREWGASMLWDVEAELTTLPHRLLMAKLRNMVKRGIIDGCPCGCRGDFKLNPPAL